MGSRLSCAAAAAPDTASLNPSSGQIQEVVHPKHHSAEVVGSCWPALLASMQEQVPMTLTCVRVLSLLHNGHMLPPGHGLHTPRSQARSEAGEVKGRRSREEMGLSRLQELCAIRHAGGKYPRWVAQSMAAAGLAGWPMGTP